MEYNSIFIEKLLNNSHCSKLVKQQTWHIHIKILANIRSGEQPISSKQQDINSHINQKIKHNSLKQIFYSDQYLNYERDVSIMQGLPVPPQPRKREERQKLKKDDTLIQKQKQEQMIKRQFLRKLKKWQKQKMKLAKRKQQIQMKKEMLENNSSQKKKKQEEEINAFFKLQKKKVIEAKIKELEEKKQEREEHLKQSAVRKHKSVPRYVAYENRFKSQELEKAMEQKILMQNRRASLEISLEQIKQHEKAYIKRIKDKLNIKQSSISKENKSQSIEKQDSFNLNKRDEQEMKKIEQKIKRIKKFQHKIRSIPLKIDQEKKREREIMEDKLKNNKKYNFLSQKALSDTQIFDNFKQFDINIDSKQIGDNYLHEAKSKNKVLRKKVKSDTTLPPIKPGYKNYLAQMKEKRKQSDNPDEFDNYASKLKNNKYKEHGKDYLKQKLDLYEDKTIKNILQLKYLDKYHQSVVKEKEIDQNFAKAIKAKIALAKLN